MLTQPWHISNQPAWLILSYVMMLKNDFILFFHFHGRREWSWKTARGGSDTFPAALYHSLARTAPSRFPENASAPLSAWTWWRDMFYSSLLIMNTFRTFQNSKRVVQSNFFTSVKRSTHLYAFIGPVCLLSVRKAKEDWPRNCVVL